MRDNIRRIVAILLEDRATTKILLSDALGVDPAFDRKLLVVLRRDVEPPRAQPDATGKRSASCAKGDVRLMAWLAMGALKEVMFQIVQRGAEYDEDKLVEGTFAYFTGGALRV